MLKKLVFASALTGLALVAPATAGQAALGPDAPACGANKPAILVNVAGLKSRTGKVRVQLYGSNAADFLAKGKYVRRIDLPVTRSGTMPVCIAVPRPGRYAVAVRHDVNGNGKSGDWSDGGGFSGNPDISLMRLKPSYSAVAFNVGNGVQPLNVVLNYRRGLSIGPVAG